MNTFRFIQKSILLLLRSLLSLSLFAQEQVYNFSFDTWSKTKGAWDLYPENATAKQQVWGTANHGTSFLGINTTIPEYEHVAVKGKGKAAAKVSSRSIMGTFATGNLYTGKFVKIIGMSGAEMYHGIPFHGRPKSLSGYVHYQPGKIDAVKKPYKEMKGQLDKGQIEIALYSWKQARHFVSTDGASTPAAEDPDIVAYGSLVLDKDTGGYIPFTIDLKYVNDKQPSYLFIAVLASRLGEFFTGSCKSVIYVDEFKLNY
ncbi:MAG: PCMD domain-containing protein [Bacteroidales bacterium]|nr:PCMD domain-containing protein [Bacteroidales bacterium]